jgi:UDP-N-acetylglucosamine:LPS N-acetylglucosamine transferase
MIPDHELSGELLAGHIKELSMSEEKRMEMRVQSRALGRPDAARKVVDIAVSLVKAKGPRAHPGRG